MAAGTNQKPGSRTFYTVGFGKFRQKTLANGEKVTETTPNAVKRVTEQGQDTWALEYDFITGKLDSINFKYNSGTKYPNVFDVVLKDGQEYDQISFKDDSIFWFLFAEMLPNINPSEPMTITVYDYKAKDGQRKYGLTIEQFNNKKTRTIVYKDNTEHQFVESYYKAYTQDKEWKYLNGYPAPPKDMNWKNKDQVKLYNMTVKMFLNGEVMKNKDLIKSQTQTEEGHTSDLPWDNTTDENEAF